MSIHAVFVPFDRFGSPGTSAGAHLLADAVREMLADGRREKQPARCHAYRDQVRITELSFDKPAHYETWQRRACPMAQAALSAGELLLWVGGNHMSVLPVLEQLGDLPGSLVVQFDAHLDVYNLSDCTAEPSHGNFLLHAAGRLPPIVHVGHRDLFLPADHVSRHFRATISAEDLAVRPEKSLRVLSQETAKAKRIWVDVDVDVFDPAYFPAVAQAQPFGITPAQMLRILDAIGDLRLAGLSISEFDPARDRNDQSLATLIWLIEWLFLRRCEA